MVLLQPKLHLKVSQRQILTPGLVQMVSVLALNKLELRDMMTAEMVENPVLEELEDSVPLLDDVNRREEERPTTPEENPIAAVEKKDPFEEIDFGSFFQEYLDPGYRSQGEMEEIERPSFENFLSRPTTLTDHLMWQLGSISTRVELRGAAELIIGNLNEDGYLIATDEELLGIAPPSAPEVDAAKSEAVVAEAAALGLEALNEHGISGEELTSGDSGAADWGASAIPSAQPEIATAVATAPEITPAGPPNAVSSSEVSTAPPAHVPFRSNFELADLQEALEVVRQLDPPAVACRALRDCLLC